MWRHLWTTDAELQPFDNAHRWIRAEGQLNRLIEVDREINIATFAIDFRLNAGQRTAHLRRASTVRADHLPLQIKQSNARRPQTDFQHISARAFPAICKSVRAYARERDVVGLLNHLFQAFDDFRIRALRDETLT